MITQRRAAPPPRHAFVHVVLPRAEQRQDEGTSRPHTVYLIRIESHLGKYPSADTYFELRYSRFQALHHTLRETHPMVRLPFLPRASWLGSQHPSYVLQMAEDLLRYARQLLACWQRAYGGFTTFIELLHALHHGWPLPPPPPDAGTNTLSGTLSGSSSDLARTLSRSRLTPTGSDRTGGGGGGDAPLLSIDGGALGEALCWREYTEHVERLLELGSGAAEVTPFEEEGGVVTGRCHAWRVLGFSVTRVALDETPAANPLKLHTTDAYILLAPEMSDETVSAPAAAAPAGSPSPSKRASLRPSGEEHEASGAVERPPAAGGGAPKQVGWRAHYWLGAATTADKAGAAAALVVQLGGLLAADGLRVSHMREVEREESDELLRGFPRLESVPGGSGAGWRAKKRVPPPPRLLRVGAGHGAGCLGQVARVTPRADSLGERHAYVFDSPTTIDAPPEGRDAADVRAVFQWHGHTAPLRVKASALLLAHTIRSIDRRGRCDVHVVGNAEPPSLLERPADIAPDVGAASRVPPPPGAPPVAPALSTNSLSQAFHERAVLGFYMGVEQAANGPPAPPPIPAAPRVLYRLQLIESPPARSASPPLTRSASPPLTNLSPPSRDVDPNADPTVDPTADLNADLNNAASMPGSPSGASPHRASPPAGRASPPAGVAAPLKAEPRLRVSRAVVEISSLHSDDVLLTDETLVLDCGSEIYVWGGRRAGGYLRWAARTLGALLVNEQSGGSFGVIEAHRESEGCEGALFRSMFATWHWLREANPTWAHSQRTQLGVGSLVTGGGRTIQCKGAPGPVRPLTLEEEVAAMRRQAAALHARARKRGEVSDVNITPAKPSAADAAAAASAEQAAEAAVAAAEALEDAAHGDDAPGGETDKIGGGASPDDGSEMVNVWLVGGEANLVEVLPESERGVFWSANAYMVLYSYTVSGPRGASERSVLYFWKGADVALNSFLTWRFQLARLLQKMPGAPVPRIVNQGEEPERFIAIMEGTIVLTGSHPLARRQNTAEAEATPTAADATAGAAGAAGTVEAAGGGETTDAAALRAESTGGDVAAAAVEGGDVDDASATGAAEAEVEEDLSGAESLPTLGGVVLLHVKRYSPTPLGVCARQVPARMYYLDSRDAFLLVHVATGSLYMWAGRLCADGLINATQALAQRFLEARPGTHFVAAAEGDEPPPFWEALTSSPSEDAAARNASDYDATAAAAAAAASSAAPAQVDAEEKARRLQAEVAQARGWRSASVGRRTLVWRARALGYGASRVQYERGRAGMPLRASLHAKAVLIVDAVVCIFVWVGEDASEDDETLAMQLAQLYAQGAERAVQVSHVLAGAEPDEFRRLFHGWLTWVASPDPHARRREKLMRRLGLAGRVLRDVAWPGNPVTDLRIAAEAAEEVLAGGLVVFSTSCGCVQSTRLRCTRARHLLRQRGATHLDVDLGTEPAELPTLRLLLSSNGVKDTKSAQHLPVIFLNGTLLAGGGAAPTLQELEDDGVLQTALHKELAPRAVAVTRELPMLAELDDKMTLNQARALLLNSLPSLLLCSPSLHPNPLFLPTLTAAYPLCPCWMAAVNQGWLLKEGGILRTTWQRRWCVLQPAGIYYYRERTRDERAAGLIPINGASVRMLSADFHFEISTARRSYLFRVDREPPDEPKYGGGQRGREHSLVWSSVHNLLERFGGDKGADGMPGGPLSPSSSVSIGGVSNSMSVGGGVVGVGIGGGEADGQRFGKELAKWMAALQRAHAMRPDYEGRHHIKRVHLLTTRDTDGLLRVVSKKQREHRELHGTPERTAFLSRSLDDAESQRLAASARRASLAAGNASWAVALPTERGGWLWRWDDGEARWARLWCCMQGRALLCYAEKFGGVDDSPAPPPLVSPGYGAGGTPHAAASGAADSGSTPTAAGGSAVPDGVDLERPVIVLWPSDGTIARSSDTVHAPSAYVFILTALSGRRHRLCALTAAQLHGWMSLLGSVGSAQPDAPLTDGRASPRDTTASSMMADAAASADGVVPAPAAGMEDVEDEPLLSSGLSMFATRPRSFVGPGGLASSKEPDWDAPYREDDTDADFSCDDDDENEVFFDAHGGGDDSTRSGDGDHGILDRLARSLAGVMATEASSSSPSSSNRKNFV